ncbi:prolyl-tRNA synthetase [Magnetococcus marinus MC-1]|uniref:Proline--tRNA ligase n=1 Tax=Magnetococcus marinus (strain ATCC BAA-1437 / JCM 17883 / MC-1) TaxID=156889 RepID=SYP_MAGMM|nr:proline--tRNA ligase [Magnetococcus marinus]A0L8I2.1 RecName: Full=Proline--tRNA ligase; AltName: Full=Prolyl-tRNA synthetase; Short=ProRS [Magnetococcus marinus MC-1]ABK44275.1 prolyl-tRNA synthetase [Magnetococcus marinus MC-1]
MRFSQTLIPTLKEEPSEAQVISHKLMLRAGLIRQLGAGIYTWLPMGLKVLRKVETIVRQEMDRAGAQEVLMPSIQPAELWEESGRWKMYGKELLRITDRHNRSFCYGPTHEEVISDLVRREIHSYKQLPANFYQIQTKFRDEVRPRFGIMRGREFLMKDAYSFDIDEAALDKSYRLMFEAYNKIFNRLDLKFRPVEADTGAIGGASSHEFHVLAQSGEDVIASCTHCQYAANLEKAFGIAVDLDGGVPEAMVRVATPGQKSIEEVAAFLKMDKARTVKCLTWHDPEADQWYLLLLRGDHTLNEVKACNATAPLAQIPAPEKAVEALGVAVGYLGAVGAEKFNKPVKILADSALRDVTNMVCGANEEGYHLTGVNWQRDLPKPEFVDLRNVEEGDGCPRCGPGSMELSRGIEVGHVFKLGYKYSEAMGVKVLDEDGKEKPLIMGCYGIGVSRIVAAAIEQNHDENGIIWPLAIAPFEVEVVVMNPNESDAMEKAEEITAQLQAGQLEVLLDDRDERAGSKFKDADLLGAPYRVLVGGRAFKEGVCEVKNRRSGVVEKIPVESVVETLLQWLAQEKKA